jgi:uncharacterized protein (DUF2384 family)
VTKTLVTELKSEEARTALAEALLELFEQWGIHEINQSALLGMRDMARLKQGQPLPANENVLERAGQLLAIERKLARLYPNQARRQTDWIFTANPRLGGVPPINLMLEGLEGINRVRDHLESLL